MLEVYFTLFDFRSIKDFTEYMNMRQGFGLARNVVNSTGNCRNQVMKRSVDMSSFS